MSEVSTKVKDIYHKTEKLINLCESLKSELNSYKSDNQDLTNKLEAQKQTYIALEEKYNILKVSKVLAESGEEKDKVRQKVNELIREVDRCMALLNS